MTYYQKFQLIWVDIWKIQSKITSQIWLVRGGGPTYPNSFFVDGNRYFAAVSCGSFWPSPLKKSSCYFLSAGLMFPAQVGSSQRALARGTTVSRNDNNNNNNNNNDKKNQDIPLTLRTMDRKPTRTKMQVERLINRVNSWEISKISNIEDISKISNKERYPRYSI